MCVNMWIHMCVDMCKDMCIETRIDRCQDVCMDMCIEIRMGMCEDMCIDTCIDMCTDMCLSFGPAGQSQIGEKVWCARRGLLLPPGRALLLLWASGADTFREQLHAAQVDVRRHVSRHAFGRVCRRMHVHTRAQKRTGICYTQVLRTCVRTCAWTCAYGHEDQNLLILVLIHVYEHFIYTCV